MLLMNMVINLSGHGFAKFGEEIQPNIVLYSELEKGKEFLSASFKGTC